MNAECVDSGKFTCSGFLMECDGFETRYQLISKKFGFIVSKRLPSIVTHVATTVFGTKQTIAKESLRNFLESSSEFLS